MVTAASFLRLDRLERVERQAPSKLRLLESWHGAYRRPLPLLADALVTASVGLAVTGRLGAAVASAAIFVGAGLLFGLYRPRTLLEIQGLAWYPLRAIPAGVAVFAALAVGLSSVSVGHAAVVAIAMVSALTVVRAVLWVGISSARRRDHGLRPALVIGPEDRVGLVEHRIRTYVEAGLTWEGSYTPESRGSHRPVDGRALVERILADHDVEYVLFVVDSIDTAVFRDVVRYADSRVDCALVLPVPGVAAHQTKAHLGDLPVIPIRTSPSAGSDLAKRMLDLVLSTIGLIALSPLLALVALAIRLTDRGPVFFRQTRVGRDGHPFTIIKFRSMVVDAEFRRDEHLASNINTGGLLFKLENDPRITPIGAIIRRLSIDELPQLWNVIRGDMSLVGPRPLPVKPQEFDVAAQIRHEVSPGITGLWQVHGANALPYADMLDLDLTYVTTRSLGLDLILLARTVPAVVFRRVRAF